jgi:hypothetical protein
LTTTRSAGASAPATDVVTGANQSEHMQFSIAQLGLLAWNLRLPTDQFANRKQRDTGADVRFSTKNHLDRFQQLSGRTTSHPVA